MICPWYLFQIRSFSASDITRHKVPLLQGLVDGRHYLEVSLRLLTKDCQFYETRRMKSRGCAKNFEETANERLNYRKLALGTTHFLMKL